MTRKTTPTAWRGDDFPSWLSPMVVKELRQGVQSGAFAWTFVGLHAAMFLALSFAVTAFDEGDRGPGRGTLEFFFWPIVGVAVLLVIPLRGLGAISGEQMGGKLDLVRLTRLSATKIVFGKWLAIVAQAALLVTAILPYVVLRYFFGDVNVIRDLGSIGWLFTGSMTVAAAAIALSTRPLWERIAAAVLGLPATSFAIRLLDNPGGTSFFGPGSWIGLLAVVAVYTVVMLEYSAAKIAPVAENHALRKRLLALGIGVVWIMLAGVANTQTAIATFLMTTPIMVAAAIEALLERPVHLTSQAAVFTRFGLPGRLAARLLTPGWATGLVFVAVLATICLAASWWVFEVRVGASGNDVVWGMALAVLLAAAVLFPLPLIVWLPRVRYKSLLYVLVQLACLLAFVYANALRPSGTSWAGWEEGWLWLLPLPLASFFALIDAEGNSTLSLVSIVAGGVVAVFTCLAVLHPWLGEMRKTGRVLAEARAADERRTRAAPTGATA
jgi:hypothetical protein